MFYWTRLLRHALALSLILVLGACKGELTMTPTPQTYFTGKQLELAQLVDTADAEAVYRYAMAMSLEDLNAYGKENMTVLMYAAEKPPAETKWYPGMTALIKAGANPQQKAGELNASLLKFAIGTIQVGPERNLNLLKAALEGGTNPDTAVHTDSATPLLIAVASQDGLSAIKLLVEHGADVNIRSSGGDVPISRAMMTLGLAEVEYLLDKGADPVKAINYYGVSFAHLLDNKIRNLETLKDSRLPRAYAIRDRIIKMGVQWPPESPEEFRGRYIAQYQQKTGKAFVFMPDQGWEQFFPVYTPAPVRKVPLEAR
jgi:hypothetical protein